MSTEQEALIVRLKIRGEFHDYDIKTVDIKALNMLLVNLYQARYLLLSTLPGLEKQKLINRRISALSRITSDIIAVKSELIIRGSEPQDHFATEFLERAARVLPADLMKRLMKPGE